MPADATNNNNKRYYCIDDIINESKPSKRQPLADATNFCLPSLAEKKVAVARTVQVVADGREAQPSTSSRVRLVESLLPCRKISLKKSARTGAESRRANAGANVPLVFPDVHTFPQRPIKSMEALDATSIYERHCDWCEAFRSAYHRGCRLYVTHSTFAAVFWANRNIAILARPTPGFKRLLAKYGVEFEEVSGNTSKEYLVVSQPGEGSLGPDSHRSRRAMQNDDSRTDTRVQNGVHGLYDVILNEVVGAGVSSKRKDIFKGDFPRLYCEEPFRHASAMVWEEIYDRKRAEVAGYFPAWVLEGLEGQSGVVHSFEKLLDL